MWICIYGSPIKFMSDNGGEFANAEFLSLCESFNITVKTTAAESPWSNGIVERNNQTIARSMDKIIEDTQCDPELALCWSVNAKNSLMNVAGFSPFQLALGSNPRLPSCLTDHVPAITQKSTSQMIRDNLNALHAARTAFISCENDEKIRRALKSNVRTSGDIKYVTGDTVLYKRDDSVQWHGPATVIGQVDQQVFVKHGSFHIRVHPCRLQLIKGASRTVTQLPNANPPNVNIERSAESPDNQRSDPRQKKNHVTLNRNIPNFEQSNVTHADMNSDEQHLQIAADSANGAPTSPTSLPHNAQCQNIPDNNSGEIQNNDMEHSQNVAEVRNESNPSDNDQDVHHGHADQNPSIQSGQDATNLSPDLIKSGISIQYQDWDKHPVHEAIVGSRAGKSHGKYKHLWNTTRQDGSNHVVDFSQVYRWNYKDATSNDTHETEQENLSNTALLITKQTTEINAKMVELEQWKTMGVYNEIEDRGQNCISLRWVLKDKIDNKGNTFCKARLCVRGFEEEQDFRTDSPTCSREGIRLFFATTSANNWKLHSMDVKGAFLQGKEIDREVIIRPPKEAQTSKLWKLVKCAYGLADAPRRWYLRIREELINLGAQPSKFDNGIFSFLHNQLYGLIVLYVDDIMWAGNESQMRPVIDRLKKAFQISYEDDDAFKYIGLQVSQDSRYNVAIDQTSYAASIRSIVLDQKRMTAIHSDL